MKHIVYKKVYQAAMAALMLTAATACTGDNAPMQDNDPSQTGRLLTVSATQPGADAQTRTSYQEEGETVNMNWKEGDVIYIGEAHTTTVEGPITEAGYVTYRLATGAGSKNATFTSDTPLTDLKDNTLIHAFYGKATWMETGGISGVISFNFAHLNSKENQRQTANESMDHIANYDFMYAQGTYKQGRITNFEFTHKASLIKFDLTLPSEGITVKKLKLSSDQQFLAQYQTFILSTQEGTNLNTQTMTLDLGIDKNGFTCTGNKLTAYMMTICAETPRDFTITVTGTDNKKYVSQTLTSNQTEPGKFYTLTATLTQGSN